MIIFHKSLSQYDTEKIETNIDINSIVEETVIVIDNIGYVAIEEGEDFIIKKVNRII